MGKRCIGNSSILVLAFAALFATSQAQAFDWKLSISDPENLLGADRPLVVSNLEAALEDWKRFIDSSATLNIRVDVTLAGGGAGRFGGHSFTNILHHEEHGLRILEESAGFKLRTGRSVAEGKPDLVLEVQPKFMREKYWLDPDPKLRTTPVPKGRVDVVTVFAHELGHAFGINGWIDLKSGLPTAAGDRSQFQFLADEMTSGRPLFKGPKTMKLYGGPLPLSFFVGTKDVDFEHQGKTYNSNVSETQNFWHYGRFAPKAAEPNSSFFGLMAGVWIRPDADQGLRIRVGKLDAAILSDLGIPVRAEAARSGR